jgi:Tol biopolymer transport system component/DNA-binding winged helix-turn-helix (wHTH) protein
MALDDGNGNPKKKQFGLFEVDLSAGELRRSGVKVRLQSQPFRLLVALLDQPGEVISREQLQQLLWGDSTTVDFDHSLGIAVNKLRDALGDSADNPRFIETLARRGYRFIAPVSNPTPTVPIATVALVEQNPPPAALATGPRPNRWLWVAGVLFVVCLSLGVLLIVRQPSERPLQVKQLTYSGHVLSNEPDLGSFSASVGDGTRLYFSHVENGNPVLAAALIANGEISNIPTPAEVGAPLIGSLSPDGSKLLIHGHLQAYPEQPLWIVPTLGGDSHKVPKVLAHDATWMPAGDNLLIANGNDLVIVGEDGRDPHKLTTVPGIAFWMRWSPDGRLLRFTLRDPLRQTTELWEVSANGQNPHPLLPGWGQTPSECCGSWTSDGRNYVFQSKHEGHSDIWSLTGRSLFGRYPQPRQITSGPLEFEAPATVPGGHQVYFVGVSPRIELLKALPHSASFSPLDHNLSSADLVEFSADGHWVAWLNSSDDSLWRSRIDGTERIELTAPPLRIFAMKWSPDNQHLALMAEEPGKPWKLYLIDSDGGKPDPLISEDRNEADPDWSGDGRTLIFGRLPDRMDSERQAKAIYTVDVSSRKVTEIPGSVGLFSPRLSPDGRYIVAIRLDQHALMLFDKQSQQWSTLSTHGAGDPLWSHDSKSVYFQDFLEGGKPIYRVSVPDAHIEQIATIDSLRPIHVSDYRLVSLAPGDLPVVSASTPTVNLYKVDLGQP